MTVLTSTMRMQLDAAGFVKNAAELAAALDRDVKRIDALKTALKDTGASDRLQASMMRLGAAEPHIEGMRRALERFRAEQGLVGVSAAQMTADQRKALRTFESVTASTMRQVIADERKHTDAMKAAGEARVAEMRREEAARVEAVQQAAAATIATERRLANEIAAQDAKAENRRIAALAVAVAERTKGEKRAAAVRETIEAEVTAKVRTESHARIAATQEEAVAIERIARHERELRVRAIQQETDAIVAARHRQAEADAHAQNRAGLGHMVAGAAAGYVSAHGVVKAGERVLEAGAERQSERLNMTNAGISPAEVVRIEDDALKLSAAVGNVSQTQVMEVAKELRSMIADPKELDKVLDPIIRAKSVLDSMDKTGGSSSGIAQLLKAGELVGAAKDPERLTRLIDGWVKVMQVSGKTVTPDQIFEFVKYSKTAGATLSDRFLTTVGPSVLQELGGSTTGNDIAMMSKTIATGFSKTHAGMREAARAGLINPDDIDYLKSTGEAKGLKPGREHAVKGDTLFQTDPDRWVYEVLIPHLEAAGVKKQEDQLAWVQRVFTGTSADFIAKTITQRQAYDVHAENYGLAKGLAAVGTNAQSAAVGVATLSKAIENLSANVSAPAMGAIGTALNGVAGLVNRAAELAAEHPVAAVTVGGVAGAGGLAASGTLAYYVATGFGLPGAATLLSTSAEAITTAAARLGVGGVAGAVEGAGPGTAAAITAGGLAASVAAVAAPIALAIIAGKKDEADREAFERTKDSAAAKALPDLGDQTIWQRLWGTLPQHADGGIVRGPGGARDDRVLARLSPGEFVINAGATLRHRAILEAINRGNILPGFAAGGGVGLSREGALDRPGDVVPVSLATDSSSAAMLRHVFFDAMYEALRRAKDETGEGAATGDGDGGGTPNMRYGRGGSGRYRGTPGTGQDYETGPHVALGRMGAKFAEKAPTIMDGLMKKYGLTREQAAGVVGNLGHESAGFTAYHEGGKASAAGGVGWAQWTGPRRRAFEAWTAAHSLNPTSDEASWRYLTEGDPETAKAIAAVKGTNNRRDAVRAWHDAFERSADIRNGQIVKPRSWNSRLSYADQAFAGTPRGATVTAEAPASSQSPPDGAGARAVALAGKLDGASAAQAAQALGHAMHAGQWCADFANGLYAKVGIKGTGSAMASSFRNWGTHVAFGDVKPGDAIVEDHGRGRGHVGVATGAVQRDRAGNVVALGMTSGNHGNRVHRDYWERVDEITDLRRSQEVTDEAARAAERAVLPKKPSTAGAATPNAPAAPLPAVNLKVAGLDDLREAHGHIDAMHRKLPALSAVNLKVHHEGFGHQGDHAPGAVRTALNGNFGSDGRRFG